MTSRVGNFSSSEIHRLMSKGRGNYSLENVGAPFKSYLQEKIWERKLQRPLSTTVNSRPLIWGTYMEKIAFDHLGFENELVSIDRCIHLEIESWTGIPDYLNAKEKVVGDIKAPWTLTSFCEMADIIEAKDVAKLKEKKPEYYWQLVSNVILTGFDHCELTIFMPTRTKLEEIRENIGSTEFHANDQWGGRLTPDKVAFIQLSDIEELPYLSALSKYKTINTLRFTPANEDIENLTARVEMAAKELTKNTK